MKEDRIFKEALNFSKIEGVRYFDFKRINVNKEVYIMKVSKILLVISLVVLVSLGGILLFYDKVFVSPKQISTTVVEKEEPKEQVEEVVKVQEPSQIDAVVSMVLGDVKVQNVLEVSDLEVGYRLREGDTIITSSDSECEVQIDKKILVRISENTKASFSQIALSVDKGKNNVIELVNGSLKSAVKDLGKDKFKVKTSTAVAAVRGTKFSVSVDEKNNTKIVVSEGKVEVGVRSKVMQDLIQKLPEESRDVDDHFGSVVLSGESAVIVRAEDQKKVDSKVLEVIKEVEEVDEDVINKVKKVGEKTVSTIGLTKNRASLFDLDAIDSKVSKDLISSGEFVKVRFEVAKGLKDVRLFINNIEITKLPVSRAFEKNREYHIRAQSGKKVLIDEKVRFDKDTRFIIRESQDKSGKVEKVEEVKEVKKIEESTIEQIKSLDFGAKVVSGYGRWPVYAQKYVFYTSTGIGVFDGERIRNLNLRGNSYSVYGDNIVVVTKDQNDYLVVKVVGIGGKVIGEFNLGETTKGTLVIGRAVLIGKDIFVPTIDGVYIVDIRSGDKKVVNIGSIYSDLAQFDSNSVVCVNEIGEVYLVNSSGSYNKISQLSATTARRGILVGDSGKAYIVLGNTLYIVEKNREIKTISLGIRPESEPIIYGNKVIIAGEKKVLIMSKDGVVMNTITLSGNLVVPPYVGEGYIVVTATDGIHLYNVDTGRLENKFDIVGNIAFMVGKKLYIVSDEETKVIEIK